MKTVLILGALSDIAQAIAHRYAAQGARILLAARRSERLEPLIRDLAVRHNTTAHRLEFDLCHTHEHESFVASLDPFPDLVICVGGYLGDPMRARESAEESQLILQTNFSGPVSILDRIAARMEQRRAGTIVGISSVAGDRGRQSNYHYGSAKAGFTAYLSGLRNRLAHAGVHVLTVKPGFVRTRMTEGMKLPPFVTAQPAEVARCVASAVQRGADVVYVRSIWRLIMFMVRSIPEAMFKRMKM